MGYFLFNFFLIISWSSSERSFYHPIYLSGNLLCEWTPSKIVSSAMPNLSFFRAFNAVYGKVGRLLAVKVQFTMPSHAKPAWLATPRTVQTRNPADDDMA